MCFSPEADLVAGVVIGAVGIHTIRSVRHPRQVVLASVPLLLAGHQVVEAFVWWGLRGTVSAQTGEIAMWVYLLFAFCVLPILIPLGVSGIEPRPARRSIMAPFLLIGGVVSISLLLQMLRGPVVVEERVRHLYYEPNLTYGGVLVALYIAAVCVPLLLCSYRHVVAFGVANLGAALLLAATIQTGFTSLWCLWAAIASGAIAFHLRFWSRAPVRSAAGAPNPWRAGGTGASTTVG